MEENKLEKIKQLIAKGKLNEALELINSNDIKFLINLGISFTNNEKHSQAAEIFKKIIEISPRNPKAWYFWGISLVNLDKNEEALIKKQE